MTSPRTTATLIVVALLVLLFAGEWGWNAWKTQRMEAIPIGATKAEVVAALGQPDNSQPGVFWGGCGVANECWTWKLNGQNYLTVCFDRAGKVACHESFSIWT